MSLESFLVFLAFMLSRSAWASFLGRDGIWVQCINCCTTMKCSVLQAFGAELAGVDGRTGRGRLRSFTSQALANTLWSFATLRYLPVDLMPVFTREIGTRSTELSEQAS